jgi:ribonuclease R
MIDEEIKTFVKEQLSPAVRKNRLSFDGLKKELKSRFGINYKHFFSLFQELSAELNIGIRGNPPQDSLRVYEDSELSSATVLSCGVNDAVLACEDGTTRKVHTSPYFGGLIDGDRVLYIADKNDFLIFIKVIKPAERRIVCRISENSSGDCELYPENERKYPNIIILPDHELHLMDSKLVSVQITERTPKKSELSPYYFRGTVVDVFDSDDHLDSRIKIAMAEHGISYVWPEEVKRQTENIPDEVKSEDMAGRRDLTGIPLFTIDGDDARDFDDAVFCEPLKREEGGWKLYVAIADVSYYVRIGTPLDREAYKRGNSVYFPTYVVPMLPEKLSNGLCSLNPKVNRLCMTCEMIIARNGTLESFRFYPAVMFSHARLTYNKVHGMLEGDTALIEEFGDIYPHVVNLYEMYRAMDGARKRRGVIEFESEEMRFFFDENMKVEDMMVEPRHESHKMIEECMIAANVAAATFITEHRYKTLFRIHPRPAEAKVDEFRNIISRYGLTLSGDAVPEPSDYAHFLKSVSERPDAAVFETLMLRSLAKAVYSPENCGHYALALENYAHFTSPIRRYPDLMLHREIKYFLACDEHSEIQDGCKTPIGGFHYELNRLGSAGIQCSETERNADEASHQVDNWLKCEFMKDKIGMTFSGVITNVAPFGIFVRLDQWSIDGLVYVGNLGADYFTVTDPVSIVGSATGISYVVGDRVDVIIDSIDPDSGRIQLLLTSEYRDLTYKKKKARKENN